MRPSLSNLAQRLASLARRVFFGHLVPVPVARGKKARRRASRPIRCWFEQLEAREVFNATYHGGALLPHVEAQAVFLGSQWTSNATLLAESNVIDNMLAYTVQSPYMDMLTDAGYNVGQGTAVTGARVNVSLTATTTDTTIRSLLQQAITLKLVQQPTLNALYFVYTPTGIAVNDNSATSSATFGAYHGAFAGTDATNVPFDIRYVVVPHPGAPNATSTANGFTGAAEIQTISLLGGAATGSLTPSFNGVFATTSIFRTNEVQKLTFGGVTAPNSDIVHLLYNGVAGSDATQLTYQPGTSPSAAEVLAHLNTIPALSGNVTVSGANGGPFTVTYGGALADTNVSPITISANGTATLTVAQTDGNNPTAAQVQTSLGTIPALTNNVAVAGANGGPFTVTLRNVGNANQIDVSGTTGGMTASIVTTIDGVTGSTSDLDQISVVTTHELADAVTDPDINYKTLGWYDDPFNVEIADLNQVEIPTFTTRLGPAGYLTQNVFNQNHVIIAPDTTSIQLLTTKPDATVTTALANVVISQVSPTEVKVSWKKVDSGAVGYRVFRVDNGKTTLLARVRASEDSVVIGGLSQLSTVTFKVEAYNAADTTDLLTRTVTLEVPGVQKPIITSIDQLNPTTAKLTWTSPTQLLTLGGDAGGTFKLSYNGVDATTSLTRTDEVQQLALSGPDNSTVQLSFAGASGSANTQLKIIAGSSPTAAQVQAHLNTIPALSASDAVKVTGPVGGPFNITFTGAQSGHDVPQLTATPAGGATAMISTTTQADLPTAAEVRASLITIPALANKVTVTGDDGGPYTVAVTATPPAPLTIASSTGGVAATLNPINGATGYRIIQVSGTTRKILATLPGTANTATVAGLNANAKVSFIVEAFRGTTKVDSAPISLQLNSLTEPSVTRQSLGPTSVKLSWPTVTGATGYRVYRQGSGGKRILVATLGASATSIKITGITASTKFQVEAFAGTSTKASPWV